MTEEKKCRKDMQNLIDRINQLTRAYDMGLPEVSDQEWDDMFFKLKQMEEDTGICLADSPTQHIDFQVVSELNKVNHNHPMLSLDKTKSIEEVESFIGKEEYLAMCKMDGLTCSLRYLNGKLIGAETRGDGLVGEDILHNARVMSSIPQTILYQDELIVDGEIICKYDDFEPFAKDYKNPRNFAAGSIRLLDSKESIKRNLTFVAWDVIKGFEETDRLTIKLNRLKDIGFVVVPYSSPKVKNYDFEKDISIIKSLAKYEQYPIDGVVFKFNSISYGKTLGKTEHHFKNAIAFKFYDETYETTIKFIEWTMGRTGILTPVAVFNPIEIDGSIVERASLHNLSILGDLGLRYQGQQVRVFKANQIIPQIAEVYPYESETASVFGMTIPEVCPYCGGPTKQIETDTSLVLKCMNPNCQGKLINRLDHFCGKKGLDIKGLSVQTLEKLIEWDWVNSISDIYNLKNKSAEWKEKTGFGEKSVENILTAIENSKNCELWQFISALGIPLVGTTYAKELSKLNYDFFCLRECIDNGYDFSEHNGFGPEISSALLNFDYSEADILGIQGVLNISNSLWEDALAPKEEKVLDGMNIAITGKLNNYKNRDELKEQIESLGGKVASSVTGTTSLLINNDKNSDSSKNKTAKKNGIDILTEQEFIEKFLTK